jgi:glucose/arabinose dehydrogenase
MRSWGAGLAVVGSGGLLALMATQALSADAHGPSNAGAAIYAASCAGCHGTDLSGGRGPSLFAPALFARLTDAALHQAIAKGVKDSEMPPFDGTLDKAQIDAVIAFMHSRSAELARGPVATTGAPASASIVGPPPNADGMRIHSEKQDFQIETLAADLDTPYGLDFLSDGRLLVTERAPTARLRIVDTSAKGRSVQVSGLPAVHQGQDAGLLDVAVSPDHARTGWIYLAYSESDPNAPEPPVSPPGTPGFQIKRKPSMTVIVRGRIDANNRWVDQQTIFRAPWSVYTPSGSHYGTRIQFDGKGHLYFALGERGDMKNAQDLRSPLGKIHRVKLDGTIPADNPFLRTAGAVPSIWSYGHRNPEGLAIDPATGLLWQSEHGPSGGDEINIIERGGNYGWGVVSKGMQPGIKEVTGKNMVDPVAWYFPTIAPSGIGFYSGTRYPGWKGSLFVAALRGQQLRRLTVSGRRLVSQEVVISNFGRVRDVTTGPDGLLYVLMTDPTGPGWNVEFTNPVRGTLVRLNPITWQQQEFKFL